MLHHALGNGTGVGFIIKVLIILGMEGADQRNIPPPCNAQGLAARTEGALGMHNVKGDAVQPAAVAQVQPGQPQPEGLAGDGYAALQQHGKGINLPVPGPGRDVIALVPHGRQRFAIAQRHPAHTIHIGRIGIHKLAHNHPSHLR